MGSISPEEKLILGCLENSFSFKKEQQYLLRFYWYTIYMLHHLIVKLTFIGFILSCNIVLF